ncbi:unnamed protein product [Microthlaspi erraticum]|uniref:Uncharacterized protein n=1 Tax=Microthlaspi erraticum TaxID=1685480 RepID=A0A6D2JZP2_9BRAS|nr:unnamed protein product [Microthlaspi erraticum]
MEHLGREEQGRTLHGTQLDRAAHDEERSHLYDQLNQPARPTGQARPNLSNFSLARPAKTQLDRATFESVCELDRAHIQKTWSSLITTFVEDRERKARGNKLNQRCLLQITMDNPEGNGIPPANGNGRAMQTRPIGLGDAPNCHQQR